MALTDSKPKNEIESKIIDTLEKIRPFLQRDGGDIAFDHYDDETGLYGMSVYWTRNYRRSNYNCSG